MTSDEKSEFLQTIVAGGREFKQSTIVAEELELLAVGALWCRVV